MGTRRFLVIINLTAQPPGPVIRGGGPSMSWARIAIDRLRNGEAVTIRPRGPRGHSMRPRVRDGQSVVVEPCDPLALEPGEVVLVRVKGRDYLHLVKARNGARLLIGNNRGGINGWVVPSAVHGRARDV